MHSDPRRMTTSRAPHCHHLRPRRHPRGHRRHPRRFVDGRLPPSSVSTPDPAYLAPLMGSDGKLLARMVAEHYDIKLQPGDDAEIDIQGRR